MTYEPVTYCEYGNGGFIKYINGDVLESQTTAYKFIPHICNDAGGWGSGFVVSISKKWKNPEAGYREWKAKGFYNKGDTVVPFELGKIQFVKSDDNPRTFVVNMIGQHKNVSASNPRPIKYDAVVECMEQVYQKCKSGKESGVDVEIHCPKFGSGLARGNWQSIEGLIIEIWAQRGLKVYIYDYTPPASKP